MRVLGIDPSSQSTGFGIIDYDEERCSVRAYGAIRPSRRLPFHRKLNEIRERLEELIEAHKPEEVAVENPFYARNIKTAMTLGQVRGAVLVAVAARNCALYEYSALEIKKAVTGYGQAEKRQVNTMVRALLHLKDDSVGQDASDALAAAYCHLNTRLFNKKLEEQG
ncbi:MAG: crossover junction endodeoxyribonuclease RuvC [Clostridiales bacterium]|nr:crossover junction endodeoxyribonuclease RuvC [Clostridiales bacterium]